VFAELVSMDQAESASLVASGSSNRPRYSAPTLLVGLSMVGGLAYAVTQFDRPLRTIGATALVTEMDSRLQLGARVDTGATVCSIHCEQIQIDDESPDPRENIGRMARLLVTDRQGQSRWIETRITEFGTVRTAVKSQDRYCVVLRLRTQGIEESVLVTLNNRNDMKYPLLLGRNFLRGHFVVDVRRGVDGFEF
jgi:hypothetical protein